MSSSRFFPLTVASVARETPDAVRVSFDVPAELATTFSFKPGQYLTLRRIGEDGIEIRRSYSICSGPGDALAVGIRVVSGGAFSSFANADLTPGQSLDAMPPEGRFVAEAGGDETYLLIAAGSGITPMMAIASATLSASDTSQVTLVYGNRSADTIMFRQELNAMKDRYLTRFRLIHVLSREEQDVELLNGRIDAEKLSALGQTGAISPQTADRIFLCGPGGMIDGAEIALAGLGVDPSKIATERFTPADGGTVVPRSAQAAEVAEDGVEITVMLDGRRHRFSLGADDPSVLDAATRHGLDLPFSCAGGMCCTCRCRIVSGSAEMAVNYSLEPWEISAGFTLACQARPTSSSLEVDFDAT